MTIFTQEQWNQLIVKFPRGTTVCGEVIGCHLFGVFVRLDPIPEVTALLEIIHFEILVAKPNRRILFPFDYPPVGTRLRARILGWCMSPRDVRLTQLPHLNWFHSIALVDKSGDRTH